MYVRMTTLLIFLMGFVWHAHSIDIDQLNAMTLVKKIDDREKLLEIFHNDEKWEMRLMAAVRLGEIALIASIVNNENEGYRARHYAIGYLGDQELLAEIAVNNKDWRLRDIAALYLDDKELLAKIAENDENETVRRDAERRLADLISGRAAIFGRSELPASFVLKNNELKEEVKTTQEPQAVPIVDPRHDVVVKKEATTIQEMNFAHDVDVEKDGETVKNSFSFPFYLWMAICGFFCLVIFPVIIYLRNKSKRRM